MEADRRTLLMPDAPECNCRAGTEHRQDKGRTAQQRKGASATAEAPLEIFSTETAA
jgi:hypothetical protein